MGLPVNPAPSLRYNAAMDAVIPNRRQSRIFRNGEARSQPDPTLQLPPEARMDAVWELTLQCLAWQGIDTIEPRLQRSVVRIQRGRR